MSSLDIAKISRYASPSDATGFLLNQLARLWLRRMNASLSAIGLTYLQFVILIGLGWTTRSGGGITQKELGRFCKTSRALTSQVLRTLERKGLITQAVNPADTRERLVQLTPDGEAAVMAALPILDATEDAFLAEDPTLKRDVDRSLRAALVVALKDQSEAGTDDAPAAEDVAAS